MPQALLIEPSTTKRHVLARVLRAGGYDVETASEYEAGLTRLKRGATPDAVVMGLAPDPEPGCQRLLGHLDRAPQRSLSVVLVLQEPQGLLRAWTVRRGRAAMLLWADHDELVPSLERLAEREPERGLRYVGDVDTPIRVLLADDSPSARRVFHRLLTRRGYDATVAASGEEAVALAQREHFDIAIIDYFMPDARGDEVCRRIRAAAAGAPICAILTGSYLERVIEDCLEAGAIECMFKNESHALFLARVDAMGRLVRASRRSESERERLEAIIGSVGEGVYGVDSNGRITFVNPAAKRILGWRPDDDLTGSLAHDLFHYADANGEPIARGDSTLDHAYRSGQELDSWESMFWAYAGRAVPVVCTVRPLTINGHPEGSVVAFRDISDRKGLERRLRWQATHDPLTELHNRRHLEEAIESEIERLRRSDEASALLYVDLDRFKYVNDTAGHAAGDQLLIEVAKQLRERARSGDVVARLGGDEFALLLRNVGTQELDGIAESYREALARSEHTLNDRRFTIKASLGITWIDPQGETPGDALTSADVACQIAKRKGRNQIHVYAAKRDSKAAAELQQGWSDRLHDALRRDGFVLHFQPIRALGEATGPGSAERYEVLIRLAGTQSEPLLPEAFFPSAERFNLMQSIDRWVLRNAAGQLAELARRGRRVELHLNVSAQGLADGGYIVLLRELLDGLDVNPRQLTFEVAEATVVSHLEAAGKFIREVRALGCRLALDDYGSGFSSYAQLRHIPVDCMKIDGTLVRGVADDNVDRAVVRSLNEIAHALGCATIAQYVESDEALESLRELGVDLAQGHRIGRPRPEIGGVSSSVSRPTSRIR